MASTITQTSTPDSTIPDGTAVGGIALANDHDIGRSLVFRVAGALYTCPVEMVREVVPMGRATRLPGAPVHILGLLNVRGMIVTVVDAGACLHQRPCDSHGPLLLVDVGTRPVGLLVDAVVDVRPTYAEASYELLDVRAVVARVVSILEDE